MLINFNELKKIFLNLLLLFLFNIKCFCESNNVGQNIKLNQNKIIYLVPPRGYYGEKFFDMHDKFYNPDDRNRVFFNLREALNQKGYEFRITHRFDNLENFAGIIILNFEENIGELNKLTNYPKEKIIFISLEPPSVMLHFYDKKYHEYFGRIYLMLDDWIDNQKYFKLFYPQTSLKILENIPDFDQKKFCCMISGNKFSTHKSELYTERKNIIKFFEQESPEDFDFFGQFWNKEFSSLYKGSVVSKLDILKNYKFCICYENIKDIQGYITEKIFDAFISGCVPVYWGADNISDFIPKNCFIDRRKFKDNKELFNYLKSIDKHEYEMYIESIRQFLKSPDSYWFSQNYFINLITNLF